MSFLCGDLSCDPPVLLSRWTFVTEMSVSRSATGVTVFDGRIFVSGGHDGLQIFNTVSLKQSEQLKSSTSLFLFTCV